MQRHFYIRSDEWLASHMRTNAMPEPEPDLLPPALRGLRFTPSQRAAVVDALSSVSVDALRLFERAAFVGGSPPSATTIGYNMLAVSLRLNIGPLEPQLSGMALKDLGYDPRRLADASRRVNPILDSSPCSPSTNK